MSDVNDRYTRAKNKQNLSVFEEIEEITKEYFRRNPRANSVGITLKNSKTGEEIKIILSRD